MEHILRNVPVVCDNIFVYLDLESLFSCLNTSKHFKNAMTKSRALWISSILKVANPDYYQKWKKYLKNLDIYQLSKIGLCVLEIARKNLGTIYSAPIYYSIKLGDLEIFGHFWNWFTRDGDFENEYNFYLTSFAYVYLMHSPSVEIYERLLNYALEKCTKRDANIMYKVCLRRAEKLNLNNRLKILRKSYKKYEIKLRK